MRCARTIAGLVGAVTVATAGLLMPGSPAAAGSCARAAHLTTGTEPGALGDAEVVIRTGPNWSCPVAGLGYGGERVTYHCYTRTGTTTWTYLRVEGTGTRGWVPDRQLHNQGSIFECLDYRLLRAPALREGGPGP